jgi:hypothetical protein
MKRRRGISRPKSLDPIRTTKIKSNNIRIGVDPEPSSSDSMLPNEWDLDPALIVDRLTDDHGLLSPLTIILDSIPIVHHEINDSRPWPKTVRLESNAYRPWLIWRFTNPRPTQKRPDGDAAPRRTVAPHRNDPRLRPRRPTHYSGSATHIKGSGEYRHGGRTCVLRGGEVGPQRQAPLLDLGHRLEGGE